MASDRHPCRASRMGTPMSPLLSPLSSHALVFGIVWLVAIWFAAKAGKR